MTETPPAPKLDALTNEERADVEKVIQIALMVQTAGLPDYCFAPVFQSAVANSVLQPINIRKHSDQPG